MDDLKMSGIEDPNIDMAFDRWFGYLSAQGDPALRIDLVTEAFVAGWNASRETDEGEDS